MNNNYINRKLELSEESIKKLEIVSKNEYYKQIKQMVRTNNLNAIYFNAWEHDDEEDPIISIVFEIVNRFDLLDTTKTIGSGNFVSNLKSLVSLISLGKINVGELINENDIATRVRLKNKIKEAVADTLNDIINENCNKLIIFIDELDRCRPDYSINLLERLNHYINDDRVIIVLSTNIKELIHAICSKYGNNFSSEKYLDKFIDERLFLPEVSLDCYLRTFDTTIQDGDRHWIPVVITHFIKKYKLKMREINRYMSYFRHFEKYMNKGIERINHMEMINYIFIPYAIGLNATMSTSFISFKNGNGYNELKEFVRSNKSIMMLCKISFYGTRNEIDDEEMFNNLEKFYNLIFVEKDINASININNNQVCKKSLASFESDISLLGDIADFQEI